MSDRTECPTCRGPIASDGAGRLLVVEGDDGASFYVPVLDIYGTAEAMALLGVQKSQFHVLARTDPDFPRPARIRWPGWETDARLAATPLYDGPAMREYAAKRKGT